MPDNELVVVDDGFGEDTDEETEDDSLGATTEADPLHPYEVPEWAEGGDS